MTRFAWVIATYVAGFGAIASAFLHPVPRWIWNASASVPIGLYRVQPYGRLHVTELVVVRPPSELASFMNERRYLPLGVPMLKRVLALPGQSVCRIGSAVTVDGIEMGTARARDGQRRPLPVWSGCSRVASDAVFLMNWQSDESFDGRYFGTLPIASLLGRADPIWTREDE